MKFVLLLTIWSETSPVPEVYVLNDNLTGAEYIDLLEQSYSSTSVGILSCEVDHAAQ